MSLLLILLIGSVYTSKILFETDRCLSLEYSSACEHIVILSESKELLQSCLKFNVEHTMMISLWGSFGERSGFSSSYILLMDACRSSKSLHRVIDQIGGSYKTCIIICKHNEGEDGVKDIFNSHGITVVKIVVNNKNETVAYSRTTVSNLKVEVKKNSLNALTTIKVAWITIPPFVINTTSPKNPGIYVSLFNTISDITGINVVYDKNFTEEFINNGTYHQLTHYLQNGSADVGIGRLYMNSSHTALGPCYFSDQIVFLARRQRKFPFYRYLLKIFKPSLWFLIVFAFVIICAVCVIINQLFGKNQVRFYDMAMELFRMYLGTGGQLFLKTFSMKVLIIFYSLYCLNMDSIYLSKLSSELSIPAREKKISHVDILVEYHVHIYAPQVADKLSLLVYYTSINSTWNRGGHAVNATEFELLRHIALYQDNSTLAFISTLKTFPSETAATTTFYWTIYWPLFVTYYLRPNNPLNRVINFWAEEALEKGFIQKWWYDISQSNVNRSLYKVAADDSTLQVTDALKIAHFEEILYVLFAGWGAGILFFLLEISVKFYCTLKSTF